VRHDHADRCRVRRGPGQIRGANPAARELFADWAAESPGERNLVRWMLTTDKAREVYLEWEPEARAMLGRFRLSAARYPDDPDVRALIAELQHDSEHVRDWWPRHDVAAIGGSGLARLRHLVRWRCRRPAGAGVRRHLLQPLAAAIDVPRWQQERHNPLSWRLGHIAPAVVIALLTIVGAAATITASFGGLYWLAAAMAVATASGLINSWVLLVEIKR
jgi:hypothetical protein